MKKATVFLAVLLALPTSVALAKGQPGTHGKSNPQVKYVLRGTLSSYAAATTSSPGSISITVNHSNYHGRALKGQTLTFSTSMTTKIRFTNGATTISDGAKGVLKFKGPLRMAKGTDAAAALPGMAKRLHIIDQSNH